MPVAALSSFASPSHIGYFHTSGTAQTQLLTAPLQRPIESVSVVARSEIVSPSTGFFDISGGSILIFTSIRKRSASFSPYAQLLPLRWSAPLVEVAWARAKSPGLWVPRESPLT